jgi:hypothetical protein
MLYVIVTNSSNVVVGLDAYNSNATTVLSQRQAQYPSLTFTTVDETTFNNTTFVGPNYLLS